MKVILLKELKGKGGEGDVIEVARGYANNYLLTQGYAVKATKGNLKQLEQRKKNIAKREEVRIANANELAEKLNDAKINVIAKVGEEGQLFGSVTSSKIADAINSALDVEIDKHHVELRKPIKAVGEYPVEISVYRDIKATVNVVVVGEEVEEESESEVAEAAEVDESTETNKDTESVNETASKEPEAAASETKEDEAESAFDEEVEKIEEEPDLPAPEEEPDLPAPEEEPELPAPEEEPELPAADDAENEDPSTAE